MKSPTKNTRSEIEHAAGEAVHTISTAANEAVKAIAEAAGEARGVIATNAAEAAKVLAVKNVDGISDHDTLTALVVSVKNIDDKLTEKFSDLKADIKGVTDGTGQKLVDHEDRLRILEKESEDHILVKKVVYGAVGLILILVLTAIIYLVLRR